MFSLASSQASTSYFPIAYPVNTRQSPYTETRDQRRERMEFLANSERVKAWIAAATVNMGQSSEATTPPTSRKHSKNPSLPSLAESEEPYIIYSTPYGPNSISSSPNFSRIRPKGSGHRPTSSPTSSVSSLSSIPENTELVI